MRTSLILILLLITVSVLGAIHLLALQLYLYWYILWLDMPMHFLGGVVVALACFAAASLRVPGEHILRKFLSVFLVVFSVGILWECFEFLGGISTIEQNFWGDTILDIVLDCCGGLLGYYLGLHVTELDR